MSFQNQRRLLQADPATLDDLIEFRNSKLTAIVFFDESNHLDIEADLIQVRACNCDAQKDWTGLWWHWAQDFVGKILW